MSVTLVIGLGLYILAWQGYQLRYRLTNFGNIALFITLLGIIAVPTVQGLARRGQIPLSTEEFFAIGKALSALPCVSLYLFRLAADGYRFTSRRVLLTLLGGIALIAGLLYLGLSALASGDPLARTAEDYATLTGFLNYGVGGAIYAGLLLAVALWMVRRSRDADRHLKIGIRIASIGLFGMVALTFSGAIPPFVVFLGGPMFSLPSWVQGFVSACTAPVILLGLSYPLLVSRGAAILGWRRQRRALARIGPLWTLSRTAFPEVILPDPAARATTAFKLRRRRAECLDALYHLRHGLRPSTARASSATATTAGAEQQLREGIADLEQNQLEGRPFWELVDQDRNAADRPLDDSVHELLETLADTVAAQRNVERSTALP